MKTFISFIGSNDAGKLLGKSEDGAVLTILKSRKFDSIHLLYNNNEIPHDNKKITYKQVADNLKQEIIIHKLCPSKNIDVQELSFDNIADHTSVFPILYEYLKKKFPDTSKLDLYSGISSGTPAMQASWILIAETDAFPIKLLRSIEKIHSKAGVRVQEVKLLTGTKEKIIQLEQLKKVIGKDSSSNIFRVYDAQNLSDKQKGIAKTDEHILIIGETGTGKEILANSIHQNSKRAQANVFELNCAGLNENLLESELFGHIKGAFTGAEKDKRGIVEIYTKGTLFLDEINSMPLSVQSKLLRFLESGEYRQVGSTDNKKSKVRIIAAANEIISKLVEDGKFRSDLYYRLRTYEFVIPPLRERKEHIPEFIDRLNLNKFTFSPSALELLVNHPFKGNIRELKIILARLEHIISGKEVNERVLSEVLKDFNSDVDLGSIEIPHEIHGKAFELVKKILAKAAREASGGNDSEAARILGVSHPSIKEWSK